MFLNIFAEVDRRKLEDQNNILIKIIKGAAPALKLKRIQQKARKGK